MSHGRRREETAAASGDDGGRMTKMRGERERLEARMQISGAVEDYEERRRRLESD